MFKAKSKLSAILSLLLVCSFILSACGQDAAPAPAPGAAQPAASKGSVEVAIGSAGAGGAIYPVCAAIADVLTRANIGVNASVQTTGGNVENLKLVNEGTCDLGVSSSYLIANAIQGIGDFKDAKMDNLSIMFSNFSLGTMHLVVKGDSPITSYTDLSGKKIGAGPAGGGNVVALSEIVQFYGIPYDKINASYVSYEDGINTMIDGNLDGAVAYAAVPVPAIQTLNASNKDFRLISLEDDKRAEFLAANPNYLGTDIPAEVYGTKEPVKTVGTPNMMICGKDLPDELVYSILEAFFEENNLKTIQASHSGAAGINLDGAAGLLLDYFHPGAIKFYKDKGILK